MEAVFNYFLKHNIKPEERIAFLPSSSLTYKYILEFNLDKDIFIKNKFDNAFFEGEFYCKESTITSNENLMSFITMDTSISIYNFSLIKEFTFDNKFNVFNFYNVYGVESFLKEFSKVKIEKIKDLETKIVVRTFTNGSKYSGYSINSSLFNFINNSIPEDLTTSTKKFIATFSKTKAIIGLVPNYLDSQSMRKMPIIYIIKSILGILSNDQTTKKYYFKGKFNLIINCDKEYDLDVMLHHFKGLENIFSYVFQNPVTIEQKKTFFRKVLCDPLTQDEEKDLSNFSNDYFKEAFRDTQFLFETYENDEVSVFLKEKKDILKEYIGISKDIISNINSIKITLNRNLITVFTVIFINFAFKFFPNSGANTGELNNVILYLAIVYISLITLLFVINDVPLFCLLKSRVKTFENQFTFLSSKADVIKGDLKALSKSELIVYGLLLVFSLAVYISILVFLIQFMPSFFIPTTK